MGTNDGISGIIKAAPHAAAVAAKSVAGAVVESAAVRDNMVCIGELAATHSFKGEMKFRANFGLITKFQYNEIQQNAAAARGGKMPADAADTETAAAAVVFSGCPLFDQDGKQLVVEKLGIWHSQGFIVRVGGVNSVEYAKGLLGKQLYIERKWLGDDLIRADLLGSPVQFQEDGEHLGKILYVANFGASDVLVIQLAATAEMSIDAAAGSGAVEQRAEKAWGGGSMVGEIGNMEEMALKCLQPGYCFYPSEHCTVVTDGLPQKVKVLVKRHYVVV